MTRGIALVLEIFGSPLTRVYWWDSKPVIQPAVSTADE
jgi:hypothetical protein